MGAEASSCNCGQSGRSVSNDADGGPGSSRGTEQNGAGSKLPAIHADSEVQCEGDPDHSMEMYQLPSKPVLDAPRPTPSQPEARAETAQESPPLPEDEGPDSAAGGGDLKEEPRPLPPLDLIQREHSIKDYEARLQATREAMCGTFAAERNRHNRYGQLSRLPEFKPGVHVPVLALINPTSGAQAGTDILHLAHMTPYYKENFFDIGRVSKDRTPGGMLDLFRQKLLEARVQAEEMGTRPRIISGGGDGTGSYVMTIIFLALRADKDRPPGAVLEDSGNGFIWTDEEFANFFPALAQLPLGSANDFAHILGWGHKYPGDIHVKLGPNRRYPIQALTAWIQAVISKDSVVTNFDIWGIMPPPGKESVNFKVCELDGNPGRTPKVKFDGHKHLVMKGPKCPPPFFICLYFTAGFMAYVVARFQLNRHASPTINKLEYVKQAVGIFLESNPPEISRHLDGVHVDCGQEAYFPPRRHKGNRGRRYSDVGFYNINWQGGYAHGADRAKACNRLCSTRTPVSFNDQKLDMLRVKGPVQTALKNPGTRYQTDKKTEMTLHYSCGDKGKGIFFQWDGEARLAFSPSGEDLDIHVRRVLNIPVVIGPWVSKKLTGGIDTSKPATFSFVGNAAEAQAVKKRVLDLVGGALEKELHATPDDFREADFRTASHKT